MFNLNIFSAKQNQTSGEKPAGFLGDGRSVLNVIDDGVLAIGTKGEILLTNPSAEQITGWSSGDAGNLMFESVLKLCDKDGHEPQEIDNPIRRALRTFEASTSRNFFIKTPSGKVSPIYLAINPMDGNAGVVVVFHDITKQLQENREQTEFISTASHEMRTPVASIEGYLGLALNPATATIDQRARDYLQKAHENTQHLGQLFQDLLDITRADDGRLKNEPVVLDAVEFARNIWDGLKVKANAKGLDYIFDLDEHKTGEKTLSPVFFIHADRDHLHEVLGNLFENAIKYTPSGRVSVNVTGDNDNVRISVTDSGIGIPAEDIPHLFQKFYRVDNSETREIGGTGLGLYLSRKLTEAMGGSLNLQSEYKKGSTFTVQLPRITREMAEKYKAKEEEIRAKILEDSAKNAVKKSAEIEERQANEEIKNIFAEPEPAFVEPVTPNPAPAQDFQPVVAPVQFAQSQPQTVQQAVAEQRDLNQQPQMPGQFSQAPQPVQQSQPQPVAQPIQPAPQPQIERLPQPAPVQPVEQPMRAPTQPNYNPASEAIRQMYQAQPAINPRPQPQPTPTPPAPPIPPMPVAQPNPMARPNLSPAQQIQSQEQALESQISQLQNLTAGLAQPSAPPVQRPQPTLADIEKMREDYARQINNPRQN